MFYAVRASRWRGSRSDGVFTGADVRQRHGDGHVLAEASVTGRYTNRVEL